MAAFEGQNWEKAAIYLSVLHEAAYSPGTSLLLSEARLNTGDTLRGEEIMMHSLEQYQFPDTLVMYVVNYEVRAGNMDTAIGVLDKAIAAKPEHFRFLWARGLVYEEMNRHEEAIASFLQAAEYSEDRPLLYYHLGICYYNIGVDLRESALNITDKASYGRAREEYLEKFRDAVHWFERSYELDPHNENTVTRLRQLYYQLQLKDKQESLDQASSL
jgi:tetratricopeptide (TPR) repeat protein